MCLDAMSIMLMLYCAVICAKCYLDLITHKFTIS